MYIIKNYENKIYPCQIQNYTPKLIVIDLKYQQNWMRIMISIIVLIIYLFNVCKSGNEAAIKFLLEHGSDLTIKDKDNRLVLAKASEGWKSIFSKIFSSSWSRYK